MDAVGQVLLTLEMGHPLKEDVAKTPLIVIVLAVISHESHELASFRHVDVELSINSLRLFLQISLLLLI